MNSVPKNIKGDQHFPPELKMPNGDILSNCAVISSQNNLPWCHECVYLWKDVKLSLMDIRKMNQVHDTKQKVLDVLVILVAMAKLISR